MAPTWDVPVLLKFTEYFTKLLLQQSERTFLQTSGGNNNGAKRCYVQLWTKRTKNISKGNQ